MKSREREMQKFQRLKERELRKADNRIRDADIHFKRSRETLKKLPKGREKEMERSITVSFQNQLQTQLTVKKQLERTLKSIERSLFPRKKKG